MKKMAKKKMAVGDIKIKLADEGGRINWVEEVEEEDPLGARVPPPSGWSTIEVKKKPAVRVRVRKEVTIKKEITYPHYMPLGKYLAWRLGKEGVKKLMKEVGVRTEERLEELLEEWYTAEMMRQPGVCKNPLGEKFRNFDVEALGEGALQRLISGWESRPEVVGVEKGGRTRWFVTLLALGPHSSHIITPVSTKEQPSQDTGRGQFRGAEEKVIGHWN